MAKTFEQIPNNVETGLTIQAGHVSQSIDAFTGTEAYDITISGSLVITGSVGINGLTNTAQTDVITIDTTTGQLYYTASSNIGGGSSSDTGSFMITGSVSGDTLTFEKGNGDTFDLIVSTSGSSMVAGGGCTRYDIVLSTDTGSTPSSGQAIFISGSVYGDNDTYGVIRIHEEDANGDNVNNFLGTTFESQQFNIHWVSSSLITTEANSSGQRFNQSVTIVTDISCSTEPAPGDPGDSGSIDPPPYVSPSSSGVGPISMVYSETLQGLKTGGTAVSLVDIYLDPLFIYADLSDTGSSAVFQTQVFRRDNLAFATEYTSESIMAYANTYLNSSQFTFDPSIYDGTQTPYLYRTASMSSEAPVGYYIFESEYTDVNLLKNAAKYEGSGSFNSKFPGWNYTPPAPTPPADPTTITKCTITTQTLAVSKSGDYWEIPWELDAYSGSYAPTSFSSSYMCFDADGSYSTLGGSEGIGGSGGGSTGATETLTALGYDDSTKLLAYVDEELAINIRDLNSAGNLDFKLNGGSTVSEASILNLIEGDNVSITLTESPSGTAAYTISSSAASIDTGSLMLTGSVDGNVLTFTKGDGVTTFDLTVDTGSASTIDTGSLMLTGSVAGNVLTFTKGDASTFDLTVTTGSGATDTGSLMLTGSVAGNVLTFEKGDGSTFDLTVTTGSGATDTGSLLTTSSISDATITFTKGDGSTFDIEVNNVTSSISSSYVADAFYTGSVLGNVLTFTQFDGDTFNLTVDTGSGGSTDTGSLLTTASISDATVTFTKGDGSTFNIEVNNVTSSISSSYATTASYGPNIYNTNGNLLGNRTLDFATNNLTFDVLQGETFQTVLDLGATHSIRVDEGMIQIVPGTGFAEVSSSYLLTYDSSNGRVQYMSTASLSTDTGSFLTTGSVSSNTVTLTKGDGTTFDLTVDTGSNSIPDTPLNSFQFNSSSEFGGSEMYYDEATQRVGININTPQDTLHVVGANNGTGSILLETDSVGADEEAFAAMYFRVADNDGTSYKKFAVIAENTGTDFGVGKLHLALNSNSGSVGNATIADSKLTIDHLGSVFMPDLSNISRPNVIGFDSATGQLSYFSTASFGGGGSVDTGSLLTTGSISGNVSTFTKGDASTFDLTFNTSSFYISSSVTAAGTGVVLTKGNGTKNTLNLTVNPGGVYDVTNRSTGNSEFSTQLQTIIGTTKIPSGSVNQSVRISEIANLELGNQAHITATQYGTEGIFAKKNISIYETGGGTSLPANINANGDITFEFDTAPTVDTPIMYHVIYTTDTPS